MSERNVLKVNPIDGTNELLINGFVIHIGSDEVFSVYRKGSLVYSPSSLQDAVYWCMD